MPKESSSSENKGKEKQTYIPTNDPSHPYYTNRELLRQHHGSDGLSSSDSGDLFDMSMSGRSDTRSHEVRSRAGSNPVNPHVVRSLDTMMSDLNFGTLNSGPDPMGGTAGLETPPDAHSYGSPSQMRNARGFQEYERYMGISEWTLYQSQYRTLTPEQFLQILPNPEVQAKLPYTFERMTEEEQTYCVNLARYYHCNKATAIGFCDASARDTRGPDFEERLARYMEGTEESEAFFARQRTAEASSSKKTGKTRTDSSKRVSTSHRTSKSKEVEDEKKRGSGSSGKKRK